MFLSISEHLKLPEYEGPRLETSLRTFECNSWRRYDMVCPWTFPEGELSGVLMSAWASTHTTPTPPTAAACPWMEPMAKLTVT